MIYIRIGKYGVVKCLDELYLLHEDENMITRMVYIHLQYNYTPTIHYNMNIYSKSVKGRIQYLSFHNENV